MVDRLCHPLVTELLLSSTALVEDVIKIIKTYFLTLYTDKGGHGDLCVWNTDIWLTIENINISYLLLGQYINMKTCFYFESETTVMGRTPFFLGRIKDDSIDVFVYRYVVSSVAVWTLSSSIEHLLLKLSPEQFPNSSSLSTITSVIRRPRSFLVW